jgi:hypothetical protein
MALVRSKELPSTFFFVIERRWLFLWGGFGNGWDCSWVGKLGRSQWWPKSLLG